MAKPKRTSLNIDPALWEKVKIYAIQHGLTASALVEKAVEAWMKRK